MTVTLKIPKKKIQVSQIPKKEVSVVNEKNQPKIKIEIIDSTEFNRANIRFLGGIPSEEIRTLLKTEGWIWNPKSKIWYPKGGFATSNSYNFANMLKKAYFDN